MFQINSTIRVACAALVVTLLGSTVPAHAGILYSTGFEAPAFTPGLVVGQNGWVNPFGNGGAVITTTNPASGLQALQIGGADLLDQGNGLSGANYRPDLGVFHIDPTATPLIYVQADARLDGQLLPYASGTPSDNGFANDLISANVFVGDNVNTLSELYISSDGHIYADNSLAGYQFQAPATTGQYFRLGMLDNFTNLTSQLFVNGVYLGTMAMPAPAANTPLRFDLSMLEVNGFDGSQYSASFDNYLVRSVPEPGSLTLVSLVLASAAGLTWLKKRNANGGSL